MARQDKRRAPVAGDAAAKKRAKAGGSPQTPAEDAEASVAVLGAVEAVEEVDGGADGGGALAADDGASPRLCAGYTDAVGDRRRAQMRLTRGRSSVLAAFASIRPLTRSCLWFGRPRLWGDGFRACERQEDGREAARRQQQGSDQQEDGQQEGGQQKGGVFHARC